MNIAKFRNILIGGGAYYLSWWLAYPLAFGYGKLIERVIYMGQFASTFVMPLVVRFPYVVVAFGVGAAVGWLVESARPIGWVAFPAALYAYFDFFGYQWARPPMLGDRTAQVTGALFLAAACLAGGIAIRRPTSGVVEEQSNRLTIGIYP